MTSPEISTHVLLGISESHEARHDSEMGLETRIFVNGMPHFSRTGPTGQKGPPPEVIPNIPVGPNRNGPFHLTSTRNFQEFCLNGKPPSTIDAQRK